MTVGPRPPWRIALITTVPEITQFMVPVLRELGHEPVAAISARRDQPIEGRAEMSDTTAAAGIDVLIARNKWSMEPLLRAVRPDLAICWGFPWRIPLAALEVPLLGSINLHPAMLPRHRGPSPIAWALRDGDATYGLTWHRMDAHLDTGGILAQATVPIEDDDFDIFVLGPRIGRRAVELLPDVLARVAAGDPGDPQAVTGGLTWAARFGEDYAAIDWAKPARETHRQVQAWALGMAEDGVVGPVAELAGRRVKVTRTSLVDPGEGALRVDTGDGPLWVTAFEPLPATDLDRGDSRIRDPR